MPPASRLARRVPLALMLAASMVAKLGCSADARGDSAADSMEQSDHAPQDSAIALPVTGAVVRRGDLVLTIRTTGQVRAERLLRVEAEAQGTIAEVPVRSGQRVAEGQVLVRLDPRPFDLAVREAEGALAETLGRYRDQVIGEDTTDPGAAAVERRRNVRMRSGVDAAEARAERARLERDRAVIRTPFAGTVDLVEVVVGQRVGVGTPIAMVVDLQSMVVEAAVLEHDLPLLKVGAEAAVLPSAGRGRSYASRVIAVLPLVDTLTRAGRVLVRFRQREGVLRPGMYADVELEATRLPDRVIVPASAVLERDGRQLVFRYRGGRAQWVYVSPGRSNGRETEVLADSGSGASSVLTGDTVLLEGQLTLTHDAAVRLTLLQQPEEGFPRPRTRAP